MFVSLTALVTQPPVVSEQDLADTYYPPFTSCANRGNASGVMCSYNAVNGVPSCANKMLLTDNLRTKWGFDGYVTSDCGAVGDVFKNHNFTKSEDATCSATLASGMDNDCGEGMHTLILTLVHTLTHTRIHTHTHTTGGFFGRHGTKGNLAAAIADGSVNKAVYTTALQHLFRVQMRLGIFDPDAAQPYRSYGPERIDTPAHRQLALEAANQGLVLVKNDNNRLPLAKGKVNSIAALGPHGDATSAMQSNYHGTAPFIVSPATGFLNYTDNVTVVHGCDISTNDTKAIPDAVTAAKAADAVVLFVGLDGHQEGEGHDRWYLSLPGAQEQLIAAVAAAAAEPITLVVIAGGMVDLAAAKVRRCSKCNN
jgi:beta-glucosidase-like glycosyl hydrolase